MLKVKPIFTLSERALLPQRGQRVFRGRRQTLAGLARQGLRLARQWGRVLRLARQAKKPGGSSSLTSHSAALGRQLTLSSHTVKIIKKLSSLLGRTLISIVFAIYHKYVLLWRGRRLLQHLLQRTHQFARNQILEKRWFQSGC